MEALDERNYKLSEKVVDKRVTERIFSHKRKFDNAPRGGEKSGSGEYVGYTWMWYAVLIFVPRVCADARTSDQPDVRQFTSVRSITHVLHASRLLLTTFVKHSYINR